MIFCPQCTTRIEARTARCPVCSRALPGVLFDDVEASSTLLTLPEMESEGTRAGLVLESRYQVEARIGRGGMGDVYRGVDLAIGRPVAIKFLAPKYSSDVVMVERFLREAQSAARVDHPNVITMYSVGRHEGRPYFVMRYAPGKTVAQLISELGRVPIVRALDVARQVCDGLAAVHALGFVHRDIKPSNLIVEPNGHCVIVDFGILRVVESELTTTGQVFGTPAYMSPEQGRDATRVDRRTDLYALGVTLFQMLSGRLPFERTNEMEQLFAHQYDAPPSLAPLNNDVSPALAQIVHRALQKDPEQRYESAAKMHAALGAVIREVARDGLTRTEPSNAVVATPPRASFDVPIEVSVSASAVRDTEVSHARAPRWRYPGAVATVALLVGGLVALSVWLWRATVSESGQPRAASNAHAPRPNDPSPRTPSSSPRAAGTALAPSSIAMDAGATSVGEVAAGHAFPPSPRLARASSRRASQKAPRDDEEGAEADEPAEAAALPPSAATTTTPAAQPPVSAVPALVAPVAPPPKPGLLVVHVRDGDGRLTKATVRVGGRSRASSLFQKKLPPGSHEVTVTKEGFHPDTRTIKLAPGQRLRVVVDLRPR